MSIKLSEIIPPQLLEYLYYHSITIVAVCTIIITIIIHKYGQSKNKQIAEHYRDILQPCLKQHFNKHQQQLVHQSPNILKIYPSSSTSCSCPFAILSFALVPRQQLLSFFGNAILFRLKDQLVVEIPLNNQHPISMTAAIVLRKNIRTITKKAYPDVKQLCKQYKPAEKSQTQIANRFQALTKTHCILVEKTEHVRYLMETKKEVEQWEKFGKYVKMIYFSDVNKYSRYPMAIRAVIFLNEKQLPPIMQWVMNFAERMAKLKQGVSQRKQALKKRETLSIKYDD